MARGTGSRQKAAGFEGCLAALFLERPCEAALHERAKGGGEAVQRVLANHNARLPGLQLTDLHG